LTGADADTDPRITLLDGETPILLPRKNAVPPVSKIERPHVEHEHRIVTSHTSAEDLPQCLPEILLFSFHNFVREQDRPNDTKRPRYGRRIFHSHRRGSARHLFRGTNQYWQHRHRVVELYFAVRSTSRGLYLMNSAAKSIAEEAENLQAFGSKARVSYHTFDRGIFRYGLAVLSVALAL